MVWPATELCELELDDAALLVVEPALVVVEPASVVVVVSPTTVVVVSPATVVVVSPATVVVVSPATVVVVASTSVVELVEEEDRRVKGKQPIGRNDRPIVGTRLIREWQGVEHCVTVRDADFEYQGRPYKSLSAAARAITGTRWNGWVFFGLKNHRGRT